ncbi:XRE family transcriptional regulator [Bifidobacterium adolescentis]|uniref:XRE family transcriptional regulator n=1 Tax=Bifidobacterium adolescentis TaxID=1680 RepID=UPI0035651DF7
MARGSKNEVTEDSKRIIDVCRQLLKNSGITIDEFFDSSGLSNNYWYKRMRYEAPLNTSDVEHIASTFGLTSLDIYTRALGSEAARAYEARERQSQITDDLIDRIAAHPEDYDMAANRDPNARLEAETPDE